MTKRLGKIRANLICRMIEKKVRDATGKHIRLMMRDVEINTKGDDVHISMKVEGFANPKDYHEFNNRLDELMAKVDKYGTLTMHDITVHQDPKEVHILMGLEGVVALKDFSVAAPFLGI